MTQSLKAGLTLTLLVSVLIATISWVSPNDSGSVSGLRGVSTGVALLILGLLIRNELKKDKAPDFLKEQFGRYFERDGFCFFVLPVNEAGESMLRVWFHNRFSRTCEAVVHIAPLRAMVKKPPMPSVTMEITCPGGACGRSGILWPIPHNWQGKSCVLQISATSRFPNGRGETLRFREGKGVGVVKSNFASTGITILAALHGHFHSGGTRMKVTLPKGVATDAPEPRAVLTEINWIPDEAEAEDH